jgi:hypothetical protein
MSDAMTSAGDTGPLAPVLRIVRAAEVLGTRTTETGARLIGHVPHVAPEAYLHAVFAPLDGPGVGALEAEVGRPLPPTYRALLRAANGLTLFSDSLSVYGRRTDYRRTGDAVWQPFSAGPPNTLERPPGLSADAVVVAGYGSDGSKVYMGSDGAVVRCGRDDAAPLNHWPDLFTMLTSEARRLASYFDASGRLTSGGRWSAPPPEPGPPFGPLAI